MATEGRRALRGGVAMRPAGPGAACSLLLACLALLPSAALAAARDEANLLLFRAAVDNWEEAAAARGLRGWQACSSGKGNCAPLCTWSGVSCDPFVGAGNGDRVTAVQLPCGTACAVPLRGRLVPELAQLEWLQQLELQGNALYGTLPPEWGYNNTFPQLLTLNLNSNNLTGPIPDAWSDHYGFNSVAEVHLANNQLTGPAMPQSWALSETAWYNLMVWNTANNQLTGTLPDFINGLIGMSIMALHGNRITGTIPASLATSSWLYFNQSGANDTNALEGFYLHDNQLTGPLPPEWGQPALFTALRSLTLGQNPLHTTLPAEWSTQGAWQSLQQLNISHAGLRGPLPDVAPGGLASLQTLILDGNNLSGSIPATWAALPSLQHVYVHPGNPQLCTQLPSGAQFRLCALDDPLCSLELQPSNSSACGNSSSGSGGGSSWTAGGGSGTPVAAIAAPVASAVVVLLAGAAYAMLCRRRRAWQQQGSMAGKQQQSSAGATANDTSAGGWSHGDLEAQLDKSVPVHKEAVRGSCANGLIAPNGSRSSSSVEADTSLRGVQSGHGPLSVLLTAAGAEVKPPSHEASRPGSHSDSSPMSSRLLESSAFASATLPQWSDVLVKRESIQLCHAADGELVILGEGASGTVYKAILHGSTTCACKVYKFEHAGATSCPNRFVQEASILWRVCHPSIVQFLGASVTDSEGLILMDLMASDLNHALALPLPGGRPGERLFGWHGRGQRVALQVAAGLAHLHQSRIVHLDLKASNVLLTKEGNAKIADVAYSRILGRDRLSSLSTCMGTFDWCAPEVLLGHRATEKADIFSYGVLLWQICTGEPARRGRLRPLDAPADCPPEVVALQERCVAVDPTARPSAGEIVAVLRMLQHAAHARHRPSGAVCPTGGEHSTAESPPSVSATASGLEAGGAAAAQVRRAVRLVQGPVASPLVSPLLLGPH